ncbi:MAG: hypothetical protein H6622_00545 [Halobacteriovoraceae bacterium]|nr:hypothetical protein [Halobacteriovoraceae bacterium]
MRFKFILFVLAIWIGQLFASDHVEIKKELFNDYISLQSELCKQSGDLAYNKLFFIIKFKRCPDVIISLFKLAGGEQNFNDFLTSSLSRRGSNSRISVKSLSGKSWLNSTLGVFDEEEVRNNLINLYGINELNLDSVEKWKELEKERIYRLSLVNDILKLIQETKKIELELSFYSKAFLTENLKKFIADIRAGIFYMEMNQKCLWNTPPKYFPQHKRIYPPKGHPVVNFPCTESEYREHLKVDNQLEKNILIPVMTALLNYKVSKAELLQKSIQYLKSFDINSYGKSKLDFSKGQLLKLGITKYDVNQILKNQFKGSNLNLDNSENKSEIIDIVEKFQRELIDIQTTQFDQIESFYKVEYRKRSAKERFKDITSRMTIGLLKTPGSLVGCGIEVLEGGSFNKCLNRQLNSDSVYISLAMDENFNVLGMGGEYVDEESKKQTILLPFGSIPLEKREEFFETFKGISPNYNHIFKEESINNLVDGLMSMKSAQVNYLPELGELFLNATPEDIQYLVSEVNNIIEEEGRSPSSTLIKALGASLLSYELSSNLLIGTGILLTQDQNSFKSLLVLKENYEDNSLGEFNVALDIITQKDNDEEEYLENIESSKSGSAKELADKIGGGHAWDKHKIENDEFPEIKTQEEFKEKIKEIIENPSEAKELREGRKAYWDEKSKTVVIENSRNPDGGTVFRPEDGKKYFEGLE